MDKSLDLKKYLTDMVEKHPTELQKFRNGQKALLGRFYAMACEELKDYTHINGDVIVATLEEVLRTPGGYIKGQPRPKTKDNP